MQSRFKDHRFVAYEMFIYVAAHGAVGIRIGVKLHKIQTLSCNRYLKSYRAGRPRVSGTLSCRSLIK